MKELISLVSKFAKRDPSIPEYRIWVDSKVAVIGTEILTHNIKSGSLGTIQGLLKYPMTVPPLLGVEPLVTHALVSFPGNGSDKSLLFAIPFSSLRKPDFLESAMGLQKPESYSEHARNHTVLGIAIPETLTSLVRSVRQTVYGLSDGNIYAVSPVTTTSQVLSELVDIQSKGRATRSTLPKREPVIKDEPKEIGDPVLVSVSATVNSNIGGADIEFKEASDNPALSPQWLNRKENKPVTSAEPILTWDTGEEEESLASKVVSVSVPVSKEKVEAIEPVGRVLNHIKVDVVVLPAEPKPINGLGVVTGRLNSKTPNVSNTPQHHNDFVPATKDELLERAMQNIGMLDRNAGLEELTGDGGRVQVDDKAMINCRADLNQLVPFKYPWAWQAYLKATEHHWMPMEVNINTDIADWESCTPDESKLITFALYSLELHSKFNSNDPLLAIYRWITNPEARQYLLRQRFEITVWGNFVHHVIDTFSAHQFPVTKVTNSKGAEVANCDWYSLNDANYTSYFKREHVALKQRNRNSLEKFVGDNTFNPTDSFEDRFQIVKRVIAQYICFGFTYNFASILQLSMLHGKEKFLSLSSGADLILRDMALHTSAGVLILDQIFQENPDLKTEKTASKFISLIKYHADAEIEYMDWWANSDLPNAKSSQQIQTLKYMLNRITMDLGLGVVYDDAGTVASIPSYVSKYDNFVPNLNSGGSSVTGGGALSFDEGK